MISVEQLQRRAQHKMRNIERWRRDRRFLRVMGKLVAEGLMESNVPQVKPYKRPVRLQDALWAGKVEPRILELLPALILKRPQFLIVPTELPDDLEAALCAIRQGKPCPIFRGIEPSNYLPWVERIGTKGKLPTTLRTFRLRPDDLARLRNLKERLPARSETDVLRIALRVLAASSPR